MMHVGHDGKSMPKHSPESLTLRGEHEFAWTLPWWDILIQVVVDFSNAHHRIG